ncbi:hypothetical protein E5K00_11240 [Hymenobacter aquaticus]|uniref:Transposase IS200-like domain-containing protein n=2 Tax=Hymenobacter aquaticus TaxID=1867101 RepID=A0A4Z0Q840_9BACT|nr:hypothetical protein E5K00_11240 [Hymenobacter aquaticus]
MDNGLYQDKYRTASTRWPGYDYGESGIYFVTICTQSRHRYFGEISVVSVPEEASVLVPTALGQRAGQCWQEIPQHFAFAVPDAFVVMPDHVHGILIFAKPTSATSRLGTFGPQSQNLGSVVRGFKVGVKGWASRHGHTFAWQSGYFDRVIRNDAELEKARQYILNNPTQWAADHEKPNSLFR